MGIGRSVHEGLACPDPLPVVDRDVLAPGDRVLPGGATSGTTWILRFPLKSFPIWTMPSISEMSAYSFGLRASKELGDAGRPPVMSLVLSSRAGSWR